ncbi:MAG: histidine phosphatase family protein [Clostridia bacterium]|nr:histidine phosphatase family protein [Clostridia bacterium]
MIVLVRHGETDGNLNEMLQGRMDTELNTTGIKQAEAIGHYLKNSKFYKIISSPLLRAKKTAEIIGEILHITEIIIEDALIERDFGLAEGLILSERRKLYPDKNYPEMEAYHHMQNRMIAMIEKYISGSEPIIMVSHGAAINAVLTYYTGGRIGSSHTRLKNGSIQILEKTNHQIEVQTYNLQVY